MLAGRPQPGRRDAAPPLFTVTLEQQPVHLRDAVDAPLVERCAPGLLAFVAQRSMHAAVAVVGRSATSMRMSAISSESGSGGRRSGRGGRLLGVVDSCWRVAPTAPVLPTFRTASL